MSSTLRMLKQGEIRRAFVRSFLLIYSKARVYFYQVFFSDNSPLIEGGGILQATQYIGEGKIEIRHSQLGVWPSPGLMVGFGYIEARGKLAEVIIGESTVLNNNFIIIADKNRIEIGKRCLIGPGFFVTDSDFHGLEVVNRNNGVYECSPVIIGDDVFIGDSVRILKGVSIGDGAVIGSGSVVVNNVEPFTIYAGVPARKIKELKV